MIDSNTTRTDKLRPACRYFIVVVIVLWVWPLTADEPVPSLVGRSGCASATCHGAVLGSNRDWRTSATVWETYDPHARAGLQLFSDRSRQMVATLAPESVDSEANYLAVLQARCVGCHVTVSAEQTGDSRVAPLTYDELAAGVSCESCHGPASNWIDEHTLAHWEGPSRFETHTGMRDLESWLTRTETCTRCHVGSRSDDRLVRDMNHDMIAAGHPVLRFDMTTYNRNLPPHWPRDTDDGEANNSELLRQRAARWKALQRAAELSRQRLRDHASDPRVASPEFADFDCFACHHALSVSDQPIASSKLGLPEWNPWYTRRLAIPPDQLGALPTMARVENVSKLDPRLPDEWDQQLSMIAREADQQSQATLAMPGPTSSELLDKIFDQDDPVIDWYDAAIWYLETRAALRDLARGGEGSPSIALDLSELLQTHLQFDDGTGSWESPAHFDVEALTRDRERLLQTLRPRHSP